MTQQQGDVRLFQTNDDGEIDVINGVVSMDGGLETSVYLSLFGGNEDDDVRADSNLSWWGNKNEVTERQYRSKTQYLLKLLPITTGNLQRIEDAINSDLAYFVEHKIASSIDVLVTIPAINTISISIKVIADGEESEFNFTENWKDIDIGVHQYSVGGS